MMEFDTKNKDNQMVRLSYEEPSLKKYGTMKDLTLDKGGTGGSYGTPKPPGGSYGNPPGIYNDTTADKITADTNVPGLFNNKSDPIKRDTWLDL